MADRGRVEERVVAPDLLEAADVVKEAQEPGEVDVVGGEPLGARDLLGEASGAERVLHLERDPGVVRPVRGRVGGKGRGCPLAVDPHGRLLSLRTG